MSVQPDGMIATRRALIETLLRPDAQADLVLRRGRVVNVVSGEIYPGDVAVQGGYILMVGDCTDLIGPETEVVELEDAHVLPGLIDAHMHFESAMLTATEFSRLSIPTGTTTIVNDPHEIGNVLGPDGIRALAEECATLPNRIHTRVPCRVPDVPDLETPGRDITSRDIPEMLRYPTVDGIGEIQGVAAPRLVFDHTPEVFDDVLASTVYARDHDKLVDGNAAAIFGPELAAHIIAGGTDISCHETTTKEECVEKLRQGVWVLMREGSTQRNMAECIRAHTEEGLDPSRLCLATDDMLPEDLRRTGHMNDVVRRTIEAGIHPVLAIQMATIHPATWMGLRDRGALLPGKLADIVVVGEPLEAMDVRSVYIGGLRVAQDGQLLIKLPSYRYPDAVKHSVKREPVQPAHFAVRAGGSRARVRVVGLIPDQNLSDGIEAELDVEDGVVRASLDQDILHIAVVERHGRTGEVGRAFVHGFGMRRGAIAETVSHDTHNIMVMGTNLIDMAAAVNAVIDMQGGLVLIDDGEVIGSLRLLVAGLVSDELDAVEMSEAMDDLTRLAQDQLGVTVHGPFMHLAFLSLATSPKWKITDRGLLDVASYTILPVVAEAATPAPAWKRQRRDG
ncbi:MAG: adenine deaminase [Microthrixaceae bacterium]|nr:adenine deaminase [Microthrixaceae bacterium]